MWSPDGAIFGMLLWGDLFIGFLLLNYHLSQKFKVLGKCEFSHLTIVLTLSLVWVKPLF